MWAGPDSAQKGWADLGPTVLSASVGLGWTRPDLEKKNRGDYFPPPILLHAEWYSFCMQEEIKPKMK